MKRILTVIILLLGLKTFAQDSSSFTLPYIYAELGYSEVSYKFRSTSVEQLYPPSSSYHAFDFTIGARLSSKITLEGQFNKNNHDPEIEYKLDGEEPVTLSIGIDSKVENLRIGIKHLAFSYKKYVGIYAGAGIKLMHSNIYGHGYSSLLQNAQGDTLGTLDLLLTTGSNTIIATYLSLNAEVKVWKWISVIGSIEYDQGNTPLYTAYWSMTDYSTGNIYQSSYSYTGSEFLIRAGLRIGIY